MKHILFLAAATLASACALNADMDDFANGITDDQITGFIPGYPDGDVITNPTNDIFIIDGEEISGQVMQINDIVTFRAADHTRPDDYVIRWRGHRLPGSSQPIDISILDDQDRLVIGVHITQFNIEFETGEASDAPVHISLEPGPHDIALTIGKGVASNIDISVTSSEGEVNGFSSIDPVDSGFEKLHRVVFETGDNVRYQIDDLVAELKN